MHLRVLSLVSLFLIWNNAKANNWTIISDERGHLELIDLDIDIEEPEIRIVEHDVLFYYSSRVQSVPVQLRAGEAAAVLNQTDFTIDRPTYLIVHGWHNDNTSLLNTLVREAVLSQVNCNLLVTDWSKAASGLYVVARTAVPVVASAVTLLVQELGIKSERLTLVGHSLGAHVCGLAGAVLHPNELVALDPALPLFENTGEDHRLDASDAKNVQVIHTCAGILGWLGPIGHVDFYPGRGGKSQPGCGEDLFCACAHGRSYIYYAESVRSGGFTGIQCDTYEHYKEGICNANTKVHMGGIPLNTTARGTYFLHVNNKEPYSLG